MKPEVIDALGGITAFLLTLMVFSYLIGDNPLYRIAMHLFVGVAAGFTMLVLIQNFIIPRIVNGVVNAALNVTNDPLPLARAIVPIVLGLMLVLKLSSGLASWSNLAMAFMVGVGAAVAVGGAINGTLFGQVQATWVNPFTSADFILSLINAVIVILGTLLTLMYFFYTAQALPGGRADRPIFLKPLAWGGQAFIMTAIASLYVGALAATLAIFAERVMFLYSFVITLPTLLTRLGL